jgi:hypothetical protein
VAKPSEVENVFGQAAELDLSTSTPRTSRPRRGRPAPTSPTSRATASTTGPTGASTWPRLCAGDSSGGAESPTDWTYDTVAAKGDAWGWRFEFQRRAPDELITFSRRGGVLRGEGSGRVAIKSPGGGCSW